MGLLQIQGNLLKKSCIRLNEIDGWLHMPKLEYIHFLQTAKHIHILARITKISRPRVSKTLVLVKTVFKNTEMG